MRRMKRTVAAILALALVAGPTSHSAAKAGVPDISDAQITALAKAAIDKYEKEDCVSLVIYSDTESYSYQAYDRVNGIGAFAINISAEQYPFHQFTPDKDFIYWIDTNASRIYTPIINMDGETVYKYYPLKSKELQKTLDSNFPYILKTNKEHTTFPLAETYTYAGNTWDFGPSGEKHLCYIAEVPDSDSTIYDMEAAYAPKRLYIGVNDGKIYRIEEELSTLKYGSYTTETFHTHFAYPESLSIPENVKTGSVLSDEYQIEQKKICYRMFESDFHDGVFLMTVVTTSDDFHYKTLKVPNTIKVAGETYKVEAIGAAAFEYLPIKKAILGKYVKEIGDKAFAHCKKLKKLIIKNKKMKKYAKTAKGRKRLGIGKSVIIR